MRRDPAYWQQLRKDRRSNIAALLAAVAALATTLAVIALMIGGTYHQSRSNPLYWSLMAPMAWWVSGLVRFEALYVRLWIPVLALVSGVSVVTAIVASRAEGTWTAETIACAVTLVAAGASLLLYRGSMVQRRGPAR